jgi:hypothetical protein
MPIKIIARTLTPLISLALLLGPLPVRAEQRIRCDSPGFGYRHCRADTDNRVELVRTYSLFACREGQSWGYDHRGVWVDRGCSAEFKVGHRGGGGDDTGKVVAGVALVGLVALLAANANKNKQESQEVASWAIGTFSGFDRTEGLEVQVTILPGGQVTGSAGSNEFTGSFKGNKLQAGRHAFQVEQSGNGFEATDDNDSRHRVTFKRVGSGY